MLAVIALLIAIGGVLAYAFCFIVQQDEAVVLKRLGQFKELCKSGLFFRVPILYRAHRVSWSFKHAEANTLRGLHSDRIPTGELRYDPKAIECMTKDNIAVQVDLVAKFAVSDPILACFRTANLFGDIEDCIETQLYAVVGRLNIAELSAEAVTSRLPPALFAEKLAVIGGRIASISVQSIDVPASIKEATIAETAARRQSAAKLITLEEENRINIKMAEDNIARQRIMHEKDAAVAEHNKRIELTHESAVAEALLTRTRAELEAKQQSADQALKELQSKNEAEREHRQAVIEIELSKLKREAEVMQQFPQALEFFKSRHETSAWGQIASGQNTRLIVAPSGSLEHAATLPVFTALSERLRSRSPVRPPRSKSS